MRMLSLVCLGCCAVLCPGVRAAAPTGDWIVDPAPYVSTVKQEGDRLMMANGLVSRTLLLKPGVTTWSFRNLMTDDVKAIASLFNPTDVPLTREIVLPLHYAGMSGRAGIRLGEGPVRETALDAHDRARIRVTIPAGGYVHVFVHGCR